MLAGMTTPSYAAVTLVDRDPVITRLYRAWEQATSDSPEETAAETALSAALGLEVDEVDLVRRDTKGRRVGARISTWQGDGAYFALARATRNGRSYGASQQPREFRTLAEREAWRDKYLAAARRRAGAKSGPRRLAEHG